METPSLVIVGAPHFFSRTTLRPLGPSVTLTASASVFMPRSRPRRASSSNAMILAMRVGPPGTQVELAAMPATDDRESGRVFRQGHRPHRPARCCHSHEESANPLLALSTAECKLGLLVERSVGEVLGAGDLGRAET